jgi:hypothetical protein
VARKASRRTYHGASQKKGLVRTQSKPRIVAVGFRFDFMVRRLNEEKTNFKHALTKFQDFLKANQHSGEIVWVQPDDVLLTGKRLVYVRVLAPKAREEMA